MTTELARATGWRSLFNLLHAHRKLWAVPTFAATLLALTYALVRADVWRASQVLLVRDEVGSSLGRPGRFDSADALKSAQETIVDMAKSQLVAAAALAAVERTGGEASSASDVAELQARIDVAPPKGTEFGRTEVLYLTVTAPSRERCIALARAVGEQLESQLQRVRDSKAHSLITELTKSLRLAQNELNDATARLETLEREVGSDLGELRLLNEVGAGDSNLRSALNQIKNELRQARSAYEVSAEQRNLVAAAKESPEQLVAAPNRLWETQPALKRLKDGLVDAQLRAAQLLGKMSDEHPQVLEARATETEVRQQLAAELDAAAANLDAELQVNQVLIGSLTQQLADAQARLDRLAGLRARYGNLVAEVKQRGDILRKAQKDLADADASAGAAQSASLITRLDQPYTGDGPVGPTRPVIALLGLVGGFAIGLGLIVWRESSKSTSGRRWSDYLRVGRRTSDSLRDRGPAQTSRPEQSATDRRAAPPAPQPATAEAQPPAGGFGRRAYDIDPDELPVFGVITAGADPVSHEAR